MDEKTRVGFLKDEYLMLQKSYEDFDARAITIKGWSATVGMVAIGGGFYQSRYLWLFAAGVAAVFWLTEALWKSFQYMSSPRIEAIEEAFRTGEFEKLAPLQIHTSWFETFEENGFGLWEQMRMGIIAFPHAVVLTAGALLFALYAFGVIPDLPPK